MGKGHPPHLALATDTPHGVPLPHGDSPYPAQCQLFTPGAHLHKRSSHSSQSGYPALGSALIWIPSSFHSASSTLLGATVSYYFPNPQRTHFACSAPSNRFRTNDSRRREEGKAEEEGLSLTLEGKNAITLPLTSSLTSD